MTSIKVSPQYKDNLTYPMVINHHIYEVEGRIINGWMNITTTVNITVDDGKELKEKPKQEASKLTNNE